MINYIKQCKALCWVGAVSLIISAPVMSAPSKTVLSHKTKAQIVKPVKRTIKPIAQSQRVLKPILTTDGQVYNLLTKHKVSVDWIDISFDEAITEMRAMFHTNMLPFWPAMRLAGIDREERLTLKLTNVPCGAVLDNMLAYVSSGKIEKLGFMIDHGVIKIGLRSELIAKAKIKTYYIADLVAPRSDIYNSMLGNGGGNNNRNGSGGQFGSSGFGNNSSNQSNNSFSTNSNRNNPTSQRFGGR